MIDNKLLNILCCPGCKGDLILGEKVLFCNVCKRDYEIIKGIPVFRSSFGNGSVTRLSKEKWHDFYKNFDWEKERQAYGQLNLPYIYKYLYPVNCEDTFLEIGGGASYLSFDLARKGASVVSVDFDLEILKTAQKHFLANRCSGYFVCADIEKLPFKPGVFDSSAGIGVLEHSQDILSSTQELNRVTKEGGYTFQTVPCFSFNTLINSSMRFGTIPHVPVLNHIVDFIHRRLLRGKYMKCGYEQSFTVTYLKNLFQNGNFNKIEINFYDYNQTLFKRYSMLLSKFCYGLIRHSLFWDIVYIKSFK